MIKTHSFRGEKPGKHLLVFGAIHGNEVCGPQAIRRVMEEINSGQIILQRGQATFVPVCNPRAFEQGVRYTEENLNRIFVPQENPNSYEAQLAQLLIPHVDSCDILLDIHSFSTSGRPFVFQDAVQAKSLAAATGIPLIMTGWLDMYVDDRDKNEGDTAAYALKNNKEGVVIECGQHEEFEAIDRAYQAIINVMSYAGLITKRTASAPRTSTRIHMKKLYICEKEGRLSQDWQHGDAVQKGRPLANYHDGEVIKAVEDGYVLLPKRGASVGGEWFYFGVAQR